MSSTSLGFVLWLSVGLSALVAGVMTVGRSSRERHAALRQQRHLDRRTRDVLPR